MLHRVTATQYAPAVEPGESVNWLSSVQDFPFEAAARNIEHVLTSYSAITLKTQFFQQLLALQIPLRFKPFFHRGEQFSWGQVTMVRYGTASSFSQVFGMDDCSIISFVTPWDHSHTCSGMCTVVSLAKALSLPQRYSTMCCRHVYFEFQGKLAANHAYASCHSLAALILRFDNCWIRNVMVCCRQYCVEVQLY